jgi:hypothetical protein
LLRLLVELLFSAGGGDVKGIAQLTLVRKVKIYLVRFKQVNRIYHMRPDYKMFFGPLFVSFVDNVSFSLVRPAQLFLKYLLSKAT